MIRSAVNPKLSTRLSITLALILLIVLVTVSVVAATTAYLEARDLQDETLLSVGYLVGTDQVSVRYDPRQFKDSDYDDGVRVWEVGSNSKTGFDINPAIENGFHTINARHKKWRVLIVNSKETDSRYAIVQKLSVSTELAFSSAYNTAIPLLGLLCLLPFLIFFVVRYNFKPLRRLSSRIESSDSLMPGSLNNQAIPYEVKPFVSAIEVLLRKNHEHNERQKRFIADAAHELRTPITALSLEIENLEKSKDEATRQKRQSLLSASVDRLQRLVNQLLDLARSQASVQGKPIAANLNELVKEQLAQLIVLADQKEISISVLRNEPVLLLNEKDQLQHLIQNAISNAIKFTPPNGNIQIEIYAENRLGVFCVSDDGPGVLQEELSRLTEPFFRSADHATGAGAGLGLAICREISENLNGTLELSNGLPVGFTFKYSQSAYLRDQ